MCTTFSVPYHYMPPRSSTCSALKVEAKGVTNSKKSKATVIVHWVGGGLPHTRPEGQIPLPSPERSLLKLVRLALLGEVQKPPSSSLGRRYQHTPKLEPHSWDQGRYEIKKQRAECPPSCIKKNLRTPPMSLPCSLAPAPPC